MYLTSKTINITIKHLFAGNSPLARSIAIIGAPSSIGIRPYDNGAPRRLDLAPNALREHGLVTRLGAHDRGDIPAPAYRDLVRPQGRPRNEADVNDYSRALAGEVAATVAERDFVVVLGGDCSIVLGSLLGVRKAIAAPVGLVYIDAHADFATPAISRTGSAASMCLALAVGRGDTPLARLGGSAPLVRPEDVVLVGRRDDADAPWYGQEVLKTLQLLDLTHATVRARGADETARAVLERVARPELNGFWIHLDADVLDPSVMPAVDSPVPDGLSMEEVAALLQPLVNHPSALGVELTIYDPSLDPDHSSAARLSNLLLQSLGAQA